MNSRDCMDKLSPVQEISRQPGGWEELWNIDMYPWDRKEAHKDLVSLVNSGYLNKWIQGGYALVPGCGLAYDVYLFAMNGAKLSIGLDISETVTKRNEQEASNRQLNNAQFVAHDFFAYEPNQLFTLVYDYTFFCAIVPKERQMWADKMKQLIAPNGVLVCLVFPIDETRTEGPPYPVTTQLYTQLLSDTFELVLERPCTQSFADRAGQEWLMVWCKKG